MSKYIVAGTVCKLLEDSDKNQWTKDDCFIPKGSLIVALDSGIAPYICKYEDFKGLLCNVKYPSRLYTSVAGKYLSELNDYASFVKGGD